ncbi:hypothetical protein STEG23_028690 [Scotinomys teguina]
MNSNTTSQEKPDGLINMVEGEKCILFCSLVTIKPLRYTSSSVRRPLKKKGDLWLAEIVNVSLQASPKVTPVGTNIDIIRLFRLQTYLIQALWKLIYYASVANVLVDEVMTSLSKQQVKAMGVFSISTKRLTSTFTKLLVLLFSYNMNSGPLEQQQVLLTAEPPLQPPIRVMYPLLGSHTDDSSFDAFSKTKVTQGTPRATVTCGDLEANSRGPRNISTEPKTLHDTVKANAIELLYEKICQSDVEYRVPGLKGR